MKVENDINSVINDILPFPIWLSTPQIYRQNLPIRIDLMEPHKHRQGPWKFTGTGSNSKGSWMLHCLDYLLL